MIYRTILAAAILTSPVAAHAWTIGNQGPGNNSAAAADSGSAASAAARSNQRQSQLTTVYVKPQQSQRNSQRTNVSNNINLSAGGGHGSGGDPSYPVATAYAPSFSTYNNCAGSPVSAGLQHALVGLTFGSGGGFDEACRLHQLGHDDAAAAYLCRTNKDIHKAFLDAGETCLPEDRPRAPVQHVVAQPGDPDLVLFSRQNLCDSVDRRDRDVPAICWRR